ARPLSRVGRGRRTRGGAHARRQVRATGSRQPVQGAERRRLLRRPGRLLVDPVARRLVGVEGMAGDDTDTRSQRERMLAGDLYIADDPELAREALKAADLTKAFNDSSPSEPEERRRILVELLGSLGEGTDIRPPFYCDSGYT